MKGKAGEQWAVANLSRETRDAILPLFEVQPSDGKAPSIQTRDVCNKLAVAWRGGRELYLDPIWLASAHGDARIIRPFLEAAHSSGLSALPVVRIGYSQASLLLIRDYLSSSRLTCVLRLTPEECLNGRTLSLLLAALGITSDQVDVLVDFGKSPCRDPRPFEVLRRNHTWRRVVMASGVFPHSTVRHQGTGWFEVNRTCWSGWSQHIRSSEADINFADFTIRDPGPPPRGGKASASLKYTRSDIWLAIHGEQVDRDGRQQMHDLCQELVSGEEFEGTDFSAGDREIAHVAERQRTHGEPKDWVAWCINHHITYVVNQLRAQNAV